MVDIIIGGAPPVNPPSGRPKTAGGAVEAIILDVRSARRGGAGPAGRERRKIQRRDPPGSKVLTIMVPDGMRLPRNLSGTSHTVMLRFIKRR